MSEVMAIRSDTNSNLHRMASPPSPSSSNLVYANATSSSRASTSASSSSSAPAPAYPTSEEIREAATNTFLNKLAAVPAAWGKSTPGKMGPSMPPSITPSKPAVRRKSASPPPPPAPPPSRRQKLDLSTPEEPPVSTRPSADDIYEADDYEPVYYFFYGPLVRPKRIQSVLGAKEAPVFRDAKVIGFTVTKCGKDTVMVDCGTDEEVAGCAFQVNSAEEEDKLGCYETSSYEMEPCLICFTDGDTPRQVEGKTFMYPGDADELLSPEDADGIDENVGSKTSQEAAKKASVKKTRMDVVKGDVPLRPKDTESGDDIDDVEDNGN